MKKLKTVHEKDGFTEVEVVRGFTEIESVYNLIVDEEAFICGGYVRYMCSPVKEPKLAGDLDIYCRNEQAFDNIKEKLSFVEIRFENDIAITYKKTDKLPVPIPIQLIKPVLEGAIVATGEMETILENFDFTVIRIGLIDGTKALADNNFVEDEMNGFLRIKNIHCSISSTLRFMKYSRKGYNTRPAQIVKLFMDWDDREQSYRDTIIDFMFKANEGKGLEQEEVDHLEALMRID